MSCSCYCAPQRHPLPPAVRGKRTCAAVQHLHMLSRKVCSTCPRVQRRNTMLLRLATMPTSLGRSFRAVIALQGPSIPRRVGWDLLLWQCFPD
jgi:hypothetical protein